MTRRPQVLLWASPADEQIEAGLRAIEAIDLTVARGAAVPGLGRVDALILPAYYFTQRLVEQLAPPKSPRLRWIHLTSAGYDNVRGFALRDDIVISCSPGAGAQTVAEHGLGLMLALARGLPASLARQRARLWDPGVAAGMSALRGKTLLIVGFGNIGKALSLAARALGMTIVAVNRTGLPEDGADSTCAFKDLDRHLPGADFVVIAAPLTDETRGLFGKERLARLGRQCILVNLSRGGIVDGVALASALHRHQLAGAGLDVTEPEPLPPDHPLWRCPNVIITPHTAAAGPSPADRASLAALTAENVSRFAAGHSPLHSVYRDGCWPAARGA